MAGRKLKPTKKSQTMRDKLSRGSKEPKLRLGERAKTLAGKRNWLFKEFYIPLPNNRWGKFLNKRRNLTPKFLRGAVEELKQVTWPSRKETWRLTSAVFLFALFFAGLITAVDFVLDKIFRRLLLK